MLLAETFFANRIVVHFTLHMSALRAPRTPGKKASCASSFDYVLFSQSCCQPSRSWLFVYTLSGSLIRANLRLFKEEFPLVSLYSSFSFSIIVGRHFLLFSLTFWCSFHSSLLFEWEMVFPFVDYEGWFPALIMVMRDREEETKLVEGFTRARSIRVICGRAVVLLREVLANIAGVVVEIENSPCFIPLSKRLPSNKVISRVSYPHGLSFLPNNSYHLFL